MRHQSKILQNIITHLGVALCILLALMTYAQAVYAEDTIIINQVHVDSTDDGYKLSTKFSFDLNKGLEEALLRGIPLYFITEVELSHRRWYWFDATVSTTSHSARLSYNVLTNQYGITSSVGLQQNFHSLNEALSLLWRPARLVIAEKGTLKSGATYTVSVRMKFDISQLPKPFQINALNNSDWKLSSDWKRFNYKAE